MLVQTHYAVVLHFDVFNAGSQVAYFILACLNDLAKSSECIMSVLISVGMSVSRLDFPHLMY